ncbi:coiled-coil domain-containing protein [[Mycoplasma] testudinis]|uniref:hypothetical protein n=1 Tax=[Mycoplasma] testudinis TaxID=33924 RepID=UPI00056B00E6|nr:hypothetical protein [[Mycoplasma] testudinis]
MNDNKTKSIPHPDSYAPVGNFASTPNLQTPKIKNTQAVYDIGFDDGYIQKQVEASAELASTKNKVEATLEDLNNQVFNNQRLQQINDTLASENAQLYAQIQSGFNRLNQNAKAYDSTREIFSSEDGYKPNRTYPQGQELLSSTKTQIDSRRDEINERLKRLESDANRGGKGLHLEAQRLQLNDELERLNAEWDQIERYKSESIDYVQELNEKLDAERNDFLREKNEYERHLNLEFSELEKVRAKLEEERRLFEEQAANAKLEVTTINAEIANKQEKIDDAIYNLNQDLQRYDYDNNMLQEERAKLQDEIRILQEDRSNLENRKKMFEFEREQGLKRLADLQNILNTREANLKAIQKEQKEKYESFKLELLKINTQIEKAREIFDSEESERNKIRTEADAYISARNLEIETRMSKLQREIQRVAEDREEADINKNEALKLREQNEQLLDSLREEKMRLQNESNSLNFMRENTSRQLSELQDKMEAQKESLENERRELESDYRKRISEVEMLRESLENKSDALSQERKLAQEKIADTEELLNAKRKEVDKILFEANERLTQAKAEKQWSEEKRAEVNSHLNQLQYMKRSIDYQKQQLTEREKVNEQEIAKIQSEIASERAELERLYVVERERQDQRDAQLNEFERNLKKQQVDFENNMERERSNLAIRDKELKDAYERLSVKEAAAQDKILKLNAELVHAQASKEDSFALQRRLRIGLDQVQQTKLNLEKERKELDAKSEVMMADLKAYEQDLANQKNEIDSLRAINEEASAKTQAQLDAERDALLQSKTEFNFKKQQSVWEVTKITQQLNAREQSLKQQLAKLQKQKAEADLSTQASANEKRDLQRQLDEVNSEKRRLEDYKLQLENFREESLERLNGYEEDLSQRRKDLEEYSQEQQKAYKAQREELDAAVKKLEKERGAFEDQKQDAINKINSVHIKLNQRENELNINATKLAAEFKRFKEISSQQKISQSEIDSRLQSLKIRQDELIKEQEKVDDARANLVQQVRAYENKLRSKENILLNQVQKNRETAKQQAEHAAELKQAVVELNKDRERFDESRKNELNQIQQRYNELEKFTIENNLLRDELERKFSELDAASTDTLTQRQTVKKEAQVLSLKQKQLKKKEFELENQRTNLLRRIQLLQSELLKRNDLINSKQQQILQKARLQEEKDKEIELSLKHLEAERAEFDDQKANEIAQIRSEQKNLEDRQTELDKQAYKLEVQFKQLQSLRKLTSADKDKFNKELNELNEKRSLIEKRIAEVEYNRSLVLSKLRALEGQLQLRRQQIEIDELRLKKVGTQQTNTLKEIEASLAALNEQKSEFDQSKNKDLEKINKRYKELEKTEALLNKRILDFKANAAKLKERSEAINANRFKLQKQYDQYNRLRKSIHEDQQNLEKAKFETKKELNKFNNELETKRETLKTLYTKVKAIQKEQDQRKEELQNIAKEREIELAKLEMTKKEIADKTDQFKSEKENELKRLSQINENLDYREKALNKIGNQLKQQHLEIKTKAEKTQEALEKLQLEKDKLQKENQNLAARTQNTSDLPKPMSHHHPEENMCSHNSNNNPYNQFATPCMQCAGAVPQTVIPYNAYQPNANAILSNPLVAMQQMISQQQIQMLQHNHQWELREINKERNDLLKKLEAIKKFRKEEKERRLAEHDKHHHDHEHHDEHQHHHHDYHDHDRFEPHEENARGLTPYSEEKRKDDVAVNEMIKRLAKVTTTRLQAMQEEIAILRNDREPQQQLINDLQRKQAELLDAEKRSSELLNQARALIEEQRSKFENERHVLVTELKHNFTSEIEKFHEEKKQMEQKLKALSEELSSAIVKNETKEKTPDETVPTKQQIELMNKTKQILAEERARYARERQALIDNANKQKAVQAELDKQKEQALRLQFANTRDKLSKTNAPVTKPTSAASEAKKQQIAQLNEQIAAMKAMLTKK